MTNIHIAVTINNSKVEGTFDASRLSLTMEEGKPCVQFPSDDGTHNIRLYPVPDESFLAHYGK